MKISSPTIIRTWTCVVFDLDGTITDSGPGIARRVARTLTTLGLPVPDQLMAWVGPPLLDSFRTRAGLSEAAAREALAVYREYAAQDGVHDGTAVFPGMAKLIEEIHQAGIPLAVATSKSESQAVALLEHFGLARYFETIAGASEDESISSKTDVLGVALQRLGESGVDLERTVLVGDRRYDVTGASAHGIPAIMVEWGYGGPDEADGTMAVVHCVDTLRTLLLG